MPYSTELRNAKLSANTSVIGNGGKLELQNSANAVLATFNLASPFAPAPANGVQSPTIPAPTNGTAAGTVAKARVTKSDGTVVMSEISVGTDPGATPKPQIIINTLTVSVGLQLTVQSWTITAGDA